MYNVYRDINILIWKNYESINISIIQSWLFKQLPAIWRKDICFDLDHPKVRARVRMHTPPTFISSQNVQRNFNCESQYLYKI